MALDGQGISLGGHIDSVTPAEVTLVDKTLENIRVRNGRKGRPKTRPKRLIADKGYDSDPLRKKIAKRGIKLISPYRENRKNKKVFAENHLGAIPQKIQCGTNILLDQQFSTPDRQARSFSYNLQSILSFGARHDCLEEDLIFETTSM